MQFVYLAAISDAVINNGFTSFSEVKQKHQIKWH